MDFKNTMMTAVGAVAVAVVLLLIVGAPGFLEDQQRLATHQLLQGARK